MWVSKRTLKSMVRQEVDSIILHQEKDVMERTLAYIGDIDKDLRKCNQECRDKILKLQKQIFDLMHKD